MSATAAPITPPAPVEAAFASRGPAALARRLVASPFLAARFRSCTAVGCVFAAGVALIVLAGWTFDVEWLKTFLYRGTTVAADNRPPIGMNPVTAVAFVLCAVSLWLKHDLKDVADLGCGRARVANVLAGLAVAAAALVLLAVMGGWDTHVDQWLFSAQLAVRQQGNRMAPNTALNFLLVGLALILLDVETRHGRRPAQFLTLTALCVSLVALFGYALAVLELYNVPTKVPMALNTALCFAALCIGTLCARLDREPMATIVSATAGGMVARRLLPAAFGMPLLLGWIRARAESSGMVQSRMGLSLVALGNIVAFNAFVWWTARILFRLDERRRLAEEQLQLQNQRLEQAVASERQALNALKEAQSQLVQTEKLAGLGQMVAGVAHEINNPLAFVSNNAAVLQRDVTALSEIVVLFQEAVRAAEPTLAASHADLLVDLRDRCDRLDLDYTLEELPRLAGSSREGLARIKRIVEDLRNFARLDESDLHEVDLNEGVRSTAGMLGPRAAERGVTVELDLATGLPRVACYPAKVNQVVMNLLANAIDASKSGDAITLRTAADGDNGDGSVRIDVIDRGCGIAPDVRGRIFDPFFTTKPIGQGTGLGLSVSYRIVTEHRGTIEVESTPGEGSRFTVRLPRGPQT